MWLRVVLCCVLALVTIDAGFVMPLEEKPDKYKDEPGCYISQLKTVLPVGHSGSSPEHCILYTCEKDAVFGSTCAAVKESPVCHLEETKNLPFPYCCPRCKELPAYPNRRFYNFY